MKPWPKVRLGEVLRRSEEAIAPQPTVPPRAMRELPIPVAPLTEQRRIVTELNARKRLQTESRRCLHPTLDALLPAVLDRAFKGELR